MKSLSSNRELIVWQKSIALSVKIYAITRGFPVEEKFGITSQVRRAVSSIPANIAEGQARRTTGQFQQALGIARGSLAEVETFLMLAFRLEYLSQPDCESLLSDCCEINKMPAALMKSLSTRR